MEVRMLDVFLNALQCMLSITLLTLLGCLLARIGWASKELETFIPRFNLEIAIPVYLFGAVIKHFTHDQFLSIIKASILPFMSMIITFVVFWIIASACRVDKKHLGLASTAAATSNSIFIGVPVNDALFGPAGLIHLLLYFISNTTFFWTVGAWAIAREGRAGGMRPTTREVLSKVFSAPLLGTILGVIVVLLEIPVPKFIIDSSMLLGGLCTPLALIFVGFILYRVEWKKLHMGKDIIVTTIGRFIIAPVVLIAMIALLPQEIPELTTQVYIIQAGLPCMTNIAIVSAYFGADREFGSIFVSLSTVVGMITVPIWMTVLMAWQQM